MPFDVLGFARLSVKVGAVVGMVAGIGGVGGCAGESAGRKTASDEAARTLARDKARAAESARRDDGMQMQAELGALSQGDVDRALDAHLPQLVACYERAGEARKYASGQVSLKFLVASSGVVSDVLVTESTLGNYPVERCLVVEGRKLKLPPVGGQKGTDFDYSLQFRSSGEIPVVEWDASEVAGDMPALAGALVGCGTAGTAPINVTVYAGEGGGVSSAGLSSEAALEPAAALCVVGALHGWKLRGSAGHVVRTSFELPAAQTRVAANTRVNKTRAVKRSARRPRRAR